MLATSVSSVRTPHYLFAVYGSATIGAALLATLHANSIGLTGPGFGLEAMTLAGRRALQGYFSGQDIVLAVIAVPLLAVISFGLAAATGHPVDGFLGLAVDFAGIGAGLALSNIFTVVMPYPMEKRAGTPTPRAATGYTGYGIGSSVGCLFGTVVAVLPVVFAAILTSSDPAAIRMPVLLVVGALYGLGLAWAGVRIAARGAEQKIPELYQIAARSQL